jgi:MFS family permease
LFFSVSSAGAVLGAFAAQPVARRLGFGRTIWLSMAVSAPFELVLPVMQRGWWLWAGAVGAGVGWVGAVVYNVTQLSFRQRLTPPAMLGRMNASMRFFVSGALPLGGLLGGLLGQYLGVRPALWIAAVGQSLVFLPTFRSPLRHLHAAPAPEPQPAVG